MSVTQIKYIKWLDDTEEWIGKNMEGSGRGLK
jgi:hypothetical protein